MLVCVSITPLGRPVVPEEYITRQTSSGSTSSGRDDRLGGGQPGLVLVAVAAVRGHLDDRSTAGSRSRILSTSGISSVPTNSTLAPLSLTA